MSDPRNGTADDNNVETRASFYVLGLLEPDEAALFEKELAGGTAAAVVARDAANVAALLAESLAPATAPAGLKSRILESIRKRPAAALGAKRASEGVWKATGTPGVTRKTLYVDQTSGMVTMLVRMAPGSSYPAHVHSHTEQCLILEGDLIHDDHVYGPGDFTWAEAGTVDPALRTEGGNLLLIIGKAGEKPRV